MNIKKVQTQQVIAKMIETIGYIKDAEKNADAFFTPEVIRSNMSNYFTGLTFAMEIMTGREFHYGFDGTDYRLVEFVDGKEVIHGFVR